MDRNVIRAICEELCRSFNDVEFRSFFKDIAHDLHHSLPIGSTEATLIEEAVELLERHKRINCAFFLQWRESRSARSERIAELAAMAGVAMTEPAAEENQVRLEASACPPMLQKFSPMDVAMRAGGVAYFVYMAHDSRESPNRALLVSGGFLGHGHRRRGLRDRAAVFCLPGRPPLHRQLPLVARRAGRHRRHRRRYGRLAAPRTPARARRHGTGTAPPPTPSRGVVLSSSSRVS